MFNKKNVPPKNPPASVKQPSKIPVQPPKRQLTEEQARAFAQAIRTYLQEDDGK